MVKSLLSAFILALGLTVPSQAATLFHLESLATNVPTQAPQYHVDEIPHQLVTHVLPDPSLSQRLDADEAERRAERMRAVSYVSLVNPRAAPWARKLVNFLYETAEEKQLDPVLMLALMQVESTYNTQAVNNRQSYGAMQVHRAVHRKAIQEQSARYGGASILDYRVNIQVGTSIYAAAAQGRGTMPALTRYNGSIKDRQMKYAKKVLAVYARIKAFLYSGESPLPRLGKVATHRKVQHVRYPPFS
jgi:soluble lytic murein transglycosylase-like protein